MEYSTYVRDKEDLQLRCYMADRVSWHTFCAHMQLLTMHKYSSRNDPNMVIVVIYPLLKCDFSPELSTNRPDHAGVSTDRFVAATGGWGANRQAPHALFAADRHVLHPERSGSQNPVRPASCGRHPVHRRAALPTQAFPRGSISSG